MKKSNCLLVLLIVIVSVLIIGLVVLLVLSLTRPSKKTYDKEEPTSVLVNEKAMTFLESVVANNGDSYYNLLDAYDKTDEEIFDSIIKYLFANGMYSTKENSYIFKQSDIKKYAAMYLMKDSFDYISTNTNVTYDTKTKEFIVDSKYKLEDDGAVLFTSIDIYEKTEDKLYVLYNIEGSYTNNDTVKIKEKYNITIEYKNDDFKIISIYR